MLQASLSRADINSLMVKGKWTCALPCWRRKLYKFMYRKFHYLPTQHNTSKISLLQKSVVAVKVWWWKSFKSSSFTCPKTTLKCDNLSSESELHIDSILHVSGQKTKMKQSGASVMFWGEIKQKEKIHGAIWKLSHIERVL